MIAKGADYYVVFDNVRRIARSIAASSPDRRAIRGSAGRGKAMDTKTSPSAAYTRRFYLLIEAEKHPDGTYKALIDECDESAQYQRRRWVDFPFEERNTGFEGLSAVRWRGRDYLLRSARGTGAAAAARDGSRAADGFTCCSAQARSGSRWLA